MSEIIERAVAEPAKIIAAGRSLSAWFKFELIRLHAEHRLFNEELQKTNDAAARTELAMPIEQNKCEMQDLESGWEHSTLRAKIIPFETTEGPSGEAEHRLILSPGAGRPQLQQKVPQIGANAKLKLSGYFAVFDKDSLDLGGFIERIEQGAFAEVIKTADVRALFNHDSNMLLARTANRSLRIAETNVGAGFFADLIEGDSLSESVAKRIERRDLTGCSFSFRVSKDRWLLQPGQTDLRIIERIGSLFDVGPVTFPAYPDTNVVVVDLRRQSEPAAVDADEDEPDADAGGLDDDFFESEFQDFLRDRREIQRKYRHAGRIISRCKSRL
jgi:hypothetical protein